MAIEHLSDLCQSLFDHRLSPLDFLHCLRSRPQKLPRNASTQCSVVRSGSYSGTSGRFSCCCHAAADGLCYLLFGEIGVQ
ncbi:hypothetical protein Patl1_35239 [Pistacia atlantica]|uniref:Uncharacterized protein n=1 Tax=Pistacia atlantica TaxID=434234 RepID=A0ACC0ZS53_9ROSI|nr:hypothetical protein Patl1_35239 [Pistacia atlantica]